MGSFGTTHMNKTLYLTWYEFKKDLQKEAKHCILNQEWLQIKPRNPLPWDASFVQLTLLKLSKATK
jgi:hypothetical protein